jgi:hypothetical protein
VLKRKIEVKILAGTCLIAYSGYEVQIHSTEGAKKE